MYRYTILWDKLGTALEDTFCFVEKTRPFESFFAQDYLFRVLKFNITLNE